MPKLLLLLRLMTSAALFMVAKTADAGQSVRDEIACYNVITGRPFSLAECELRACRGTDGSGRQFPGFQGRYGDGFGPCIRPREEGESNNEFDCAFGPGFLASRGKPVQAFSSPLCADAKWEFRQCVNGTMLGSYQYPSCR